MKERKINMYKEKITELLLSTNREGMDKLVEHMENGGFFTAPCSTRYHGFMNIPDGIDEELPFN